MDFPKSKRLVLIFVDGLGIGVDDPDRNPMARVRGQYLSIFSDTNTLDGKIKN